jgi:hypothetical protein
MTAAGKAYSGRGPLLPSPHGGAHSSRIGGATTRSRSVRSWWPSSTLAGGGDSGVSGRGFVPRPHGSRAVCAPSFAERACQVGVVVVSRRIQDPTADGHQCARHVLRLFVHLREVSP